MSVGNWLYGLGKSLDPAQSSQARKDAAEKERLERESRYKEFEDWFQQREKLGTLSHTQAQQVYNMTQDGLDRGVGRQGQTIGQQVDAITRVAPVLTGGKIALGDANTDNTIRVGNAATDNVIRLGGANTNQYGQNLQHLAGLHNTVVPTLAKSIATTQEPVIGLARFAIEQDTARATADREFLKYVNEARKPNLVKELLNAVPGIALTALALRS